MSIPDYPDLWEGSYPTEEEEPRRERIVTRFAPNTNGSLHLGHLRTLVGAYAYAKALGGKFHLRLDDAWLLGPLDDENSRAESAKFSKRILEEVRWIGMLPDAIYRLSDFVDEGMKIAKNLPYYRCKCPLPPGAKIPHPYTNGPDPCAEKSIGGSAVRIRTPMKDDYDLLDCYYDPCALQHVRSKRFQNPLLAVEHYEGFPMQSLHWHLEEVFLFAVADYVMGVTHVFRGREIQHMHRADLSYWKALGSRPPAYAYLPTVVSPVMVQLRTSSSATTLTQYREAGYSPEELVDYVLADPRMFHVLGNVDQLHAGRRPPEVVGEPGLPGFIAGHNGI